VEHDDIAKESLRDTECPRIVPYSKVIELFGQLPLEFSLLPLLIRLFLSACHVEGNQ